MASRFWAGGSSSEEESDHSSDSEVEISHQQQARAASRWAVESDSESDDDVRVVKSAKDKAFDNIEKACGAIKNHIKINDWTKILAEFDALAKHLDKAKAVLQAQGSPTFYIRTMVQLEDFLNEKVKNKAEQKKMSKENSKALIRMKGKLKKHFEGSLQSEVDKFRANPVESSASEASSDSSDDDDSDDDDSDDDSDKDSDDDDSDDKSASEKDSDDDSDDDDSDDDDSDDDDSWPSQSDSSDSDDSEDDGELKGRAKWLKQAPTVGKKTTKADKRERGPRAEKVRRDSIEVKKPVEEELKLSHSQFDRRIKEIVAQRGKKGTELAEQLATLRKLANYSRRLGPARQVIAYMYILGAQMFDASNKIDRVMSASNWKSSRNDLSTILTLLEKNPGFTLTPLTTEDQADIVRAGREGASAAVLAAEAEEEDASFVDTLPQAGEKGPIKVSGDLAAFVERLSEEYTKSLQQTDPHTSEYIGRLFDEGLLIDVAHRVQNYYDRKRDYVRASNVALIRAELIYYKHESIAKALHESQAKRRVYGDPSMIHPACNSTVAKKTPIAEYNPATMHPGALAGQPTVTVKPIDAEKDLRDVCLFVFRHADNRAKTRAMLCRIYHHALHDRFHEARDLLLMSHIQDNITDADVSTQILFNRMMAQLGLCAFRIGLIWEAHACLSEICTGSRTKELLAQGMQSFRFQERDPEQERLERRRQVPYHMHINLDLLETCHLVGAMLLEVPNMVNTRVSDRKRVVSKAFRKLLEFHERLVFEGPPENPRDHVVAAAKALAQGSWKKCAEYILGLSVWDLFPGPNVSGRVKEMVRQKIQVEALRTYLLAFSEEYDSVSLARLTEMFELDATTVHSVVSKMMINEELQGAWDQSSQSIVLHKNGRSNLHTLALQYSEKLATIVENNERMMDLRSGSAKDDWNNRRGGDNRRNQGGDNRDNRRFQGGGGGGRGRSGDRQQGSFRPHGGRGGGDGRRNQGAGGRGGGRGGGNRN